MFVADQAKSPRYGFIEFFRNYILKFLLRTNDKNALKLNTKERSFDRSSSQSKLRIIKKQ